uniref:Uncharacterized protein n=1 Tax=Grammatophora oceanica TaxID=210454 RepID=A0A7S1VUR5_9STRA
MAGRRSLEPDRRKEILDAIQTMLVDTPSLELVNWEFYDSQQNNNDGNVDPHAQILEVMKHAVVVLGPHGANLWNAVFMPPGGLVMEFNTWQYEFTDQDCRTYGYSMANAAGHSFALVETEGFGYENRDLLPPVQDVVAIMEDFLRTKNLLKT